MRIGHNEMSVPLTGIEPPFALTDFRTMFRMKADDCSCHLMTKNFQIKPDNLKKLHVKKFINMD